jgi:transcriptional regulator with XRE-family HTH domain/tetratricopeptide (TPR) repeat protein
VHRVITVQCWTGAETKALRQAMRLSIRAFAAYLGIDARTVNKWEARHTTITLRPHTQELLDTALQQAPEDVQTRFSQTVRSTQQELHENATQPAASAHDLHAEPAPGVDSFTPLVGNDGSDSLLTELARNPGIISGMPYSDDDKIAEYSEERPEGPGSHQGDLAAQSPSLIQFGPADDVVTLFAANLALFTTAAQSINEGKGYNELLTSVRRLVDRLNRRGLLQLFGLTATTAFISSWLDGLDPGEQQRVVAAIVKPERVDAQVIGHIESVLFDAHLSNDKLGPRAALHTVLAQQEILQAMTTACPDELRPRLLSVLGNSLRSAGWISFNAGDLAVTRRYYEKARVVAHDAGDLELATIVLANLSHAAESSGMSAMSVDYAVAAQTWAARAHNPCLSAFAADISACAFAAMGDYNTTMRHLDSTQTYLPECSEQSPPTFYTYSEGLHVARKGQCLLKLDRTADAVQAIGESLELYIAEPPDSPSSMYRNINIAMAKLELSAAHVQAGDIDEGTTILANVGDFVSQNRATRLVKRVRSVRAALEPWQDTPAVKQLDDQLHGSGLRS